jgi:hypothetical protein
MGVKSREHKGLQKVCVFWGNNEGVGYEGGHSCNQRFELFFIRDFLGVPPKANAEMITLVSIITLSFLFVRLSPYCFHGIFNITNG